MKRCHLDANIVLRFLRNDDPKQSPAARRLIEAGQAGRIRLVLSTVTVAEVFYAFRTSYKMSRAEASDHLAALLGSSVFELENEARVLNTLQYVEKFNVDFGDAYLAVTAAESGDLIASFDQDFKRFPRVTLYSM